jgi:hypothetical protein
LLKSLLEVGDTLDLGGALCGRNLASFEIRDSRVYRPQPTLAGEARCDAGLDPLLQLGDARIVVTSLR